VTAAVLTAAFYFTAYRPTLAAEAALARATEAVQFGRVEQAEAEFLAAAQADPYAPQPWQELASLYAGQWIRTGSQPSLDAFERSWREAVQRNGRSFGLWRTIGDLYGQGFARRPDKEILQVSLAAYRRAVSLYPTHAGLRVQLAWRQHLAGDRAAAAQQAARALQLDQQNPHVEQKLARFEAPDGSGANNLEHLAEKLRKLEESHVERNSFRSPGAEGAPKKTE
jgi:Tfp pilus assembly protein PilF